MVKPQMRSVASMVYMASIGRGALESMKLAWAVESKLAVHALIRVQPIDFPEFAQATRGAQP